MQGTLSTEQGQIPLWGMSIRSKQSVLVALNCIQEPSQKSQAMWKKQSKEEADSSQCTFTEQKFH